VKPFVSLSFSSFVCTEYLQPVAWFTRRHSSWNRASGRVCLS
jgi:hypothetical protein